MLTNEFHFSDCSEKQLRVRIEITLPKYVEGVKIRKIQLTENKISRFLPSINSERTNEITCIILHIYQKHTYKYKKWLTITKINYKFVGNTISDGSGNVDEIKFIFQYLTSRTQSCVYFDNLPLLNTTPTTGQGTSLSGFGKSSSKEYLSCNVIVSICFSSFPKRNQTRKIIFTRCCWMKTSKRSASLSFTSINFCKLEKFFQIVNN